MEKKKTVLNVNWCTLQPKDEQERALFHQFRLNDIAWFYQFVCLIKVLHWLTYVSGAVRQQYPQASEICAL